MTQLTAAQPFNIRHQHLSVTDSTNSQLIAAMRASFRHAHGENLNAANALFDWQPRPHYAQPYRLTTDYQQAGRGQYGRPWQSPCGNLYYSLYIPMKKYADPPALQSHWILTRPIDGRLSLCVGYQLAQMLAGKGMDTTYDHPAASALGVKWVNDIGWYIGSDFCKMAGILLEPVTVKGEMLGVVMGVGINVTNAPILPNLAESNYRAVALVDVLLAHQVPLLADLAQMVDVAIFRALRQFNGLCNTQAAQDFCQQFAAVDLLLGKRVRVLSTQGNAPMIGIAHGIDAAGCLQLCLSDNVNPATITRIWNGRVRVL